MKTYQAVGMTRSNNVLRLRWSNDPSKCKMLYRAKGEKDIIMIELSHPLSKLDSVKYLKHRVSEFHGEEHMKVINQYLENHE